MAPPADGVVLYRRARSSWRSVQSSESNELPASLRVAGCPAGSEPTGKDTVPQVRETGAATIPEEARKEHALGGTTTKARLPVLLG